MRKIEVTISEDALEFIRSKAKELEFEEGEWALQIHASVVGGLLLFDVQKIEVLEKEPLMFLMHEKGYKELDFPIYFDQTQMDYLPNEMHIHMHENGEKLDFN